MGHRRVASWFLSGGLFVAAIALGGACSSKASTAPAAQNHGVTDRTFANNGFENGAAGAAPQSWVVTDNLNTNGVDGKTPETLAGLQLAAGGKGLTTEIAAVNQPDPDLGATASLRLCRYGAQCARVNFHSSTNFSTGGGGNNGQNVNTLSQTMTVAAADVDAVDNQVHIRFVVAPVLQNPRHAADLQPYYFVQLTNLSQGNAILYRDFNLSAQPGVPWKTVNGGTANEIDYVDWSLVDISPGAPALVVGDMVELQIIASGCQPGGHFGEIYVDGNGMGSTIPGLFIGGTGPAQVNPGGDVTYTLTYKNGSAAVACSVAAPCADAGACVGGFCAEDGVVIDFNTPPGTTFQSLTPPAGATCVTPAVGAAGVIVCTFTGPVPAGASGSMMLTVNITAPGATCTTTANCSTGAPVCAVGASSCMAGVPVCAAGTPTCATGTPACDGTTPVCTLGETCDGGQCLYPQIVAGNYGISSTQETPLLGSKVITTDGCTLDSDCPAGDWCNETLALCTPTLANGVPVPTDMGHNPVLNGMCTAAAGLLVCTSKVCDTRDNECGFANGDGMCDAGDVTVVCRSGACDPDGRCGLANGDGLCDEATNGPSICRSGICDTDNLCGLAIGDGTCTTAAMCRSGACSVSGKCEPTGGCEVDADCPAGQWCDEMVAACKAQLPNGTAVPSDSPHMNPTLDGMCRADAAMLVCVSGVCDTKDDECGFDDGDGSCTSMSAATVCRSGTCSSSGVCEPMGGCEVDADCTMAGTWCDESMQHCMPQLANGTAIPTDSPHMNPTLAGKCTTDAAMLVCASGVCDKDDKCGFANGDGPCTDMNGGSVCRSSLCATTGDNAGLCVGCLMDSQCPMGTPLCSLTTNACVQCNTSTMCPSEQPVCNTTTSACVQCNGDNGSGASHACPTATDPLCFLSGSMAGECGKCTSNADCAGRAADLCDTTSGECTATCATDADCKSTQWCNAAPGSRGMCVAKLANGTPLPSSPTTVSTCSATVGERVCVSTACDGKTNQCGFTISDGPCTSTAECIDGTCDLATKVCVAPGCKKDTDCSMNDFCAATGKCTPKLTTGASCDRTAECASADCSGGVCSTLVSSGNGLCSVEAPGGTGSDGARDTGVFGFLLAAFGVGYRRRRRAA